MDDFETLADWTFTGGGGTGSLVADTVHNRGTGSQSMRLTMDAESTIVAVRSIALDLSKFVAANDAGAIPYLKLSYYTDDLTAIQAINIKLSCATDGGFDKDYYKMAITLGGYVYTTLSPTGEETGSGTYESVTHGYDDPAVFYYNQQASVEEPPLYIQQPDGTYVQVERPTEIKTITIKAKSRDIISGSGTWTDLKLPMSKFSRIGDTANRNWSTITAICIEVQASAVAADISFDDWIMIGGGNLFGHYWAAVAYQNAQGNYGAFSDFAGPVELDSQSLMISGLTPDPDPQTTKRRIAVLGGSLTQPMITYLEDNVSTSKEFNEIESSLYTTESYFNNRKPPAGAVSMAEIAGRIFMVAADNSLIYSESGMYEAFPLKNYRTLVGGEKLYQVAMFSDGYVVARGKGREYITQITASSPAYWTTVLGAKQGAVSSRLLLEDPTGPQVFMSERGFYASGGGTRGEYLDKINPAITNHSGVFGDMIPDRAYLCFLDTSSTYRVLRIDYRLGRPVAHYVANLQPSAICADNIANKVFYALGSNIYEFDAGASKLAATLTIPNLHCDVAGLKSYEALAYELTGASMTAAFEIDRVSQNNDITLAVATRKDTPKGLPIMDGSLMKMTLTSQAGDEFTIYLPWTLIFAVI